MSEQEINFSNFGLKSEVVDAVNDLGYELPTPVQLEAIPIVIEGKDLIAQAQTGTGKTAAFALPLLTCIDINLRCPQVLVLTPTRELSIQVSEAFQSYSKKLSGFHVVPIYGGQDYRQQFKALERGVHVIVGTPGRVMDHIRRGSLKLDSLRCLVLDEADEMLRMGFIDDVEWVLQQIPNEHQTVLFSATMPNAIKKIANTYLKTPTMLNIKVKTAESSLIRQRYCRVNNAQKLDALTRILEIEETDGSIVFVRTKIQTVELKDRLAARGFAADALNGDVAQNLREKVLNRFRKGKLDVLIATDVAARGIDVPRTSHVINYDAPYDIESYIHRIGRTGRAGKEGDAILFITPRENRLLNAIERATKQRVELMRLPSNEAVNTHRISQFKQRITENLVDDAALIPYIKVIESYKNEHETTEIKIAAALVSMMQGDGSLLLEGPEDKRAGSKDQDQYRSKSSGRDDQRRSKSYERDDQRRSRSSEREDQGSRSRKGPFKDNKARDDRGLGRFRIEVGRDHQVKPGNIVGAIANESGLDSSQIGGIEIFDSYSTIDLPDSMPSSMQQLLKKTRVCGKPLDISRLGNADSKSSERSYKNKSQDDKGYRRNSDDKGRRRSQDDKGYRRSSDDKDQRRSQDDKGYRRSSDDKDQRRGQDDKGQRRGAGGKEFVFKGSDRKGRANTDKSQSKGGGAKKVLSLKKKVKKSSDRFKSKDPS